MSSIPRKQLFVDRKVQGALILRCALYWLCCVVTITSLILIWRIIVGGPARPFSAQLDDLWTQFAPAYVASILVLILAMIDSVRLSNRFVGPLYRVRSALRQLANGEVVKPIKFRDHDFWQELADEFNQVAALVERTRAGSDAAKNHAPPSTEPVAAL